MTTGAAGNKAANSTPPASNEANSAAGTTVSGTFKTKKSGTVQICVNKTPQVPWQSVTDGKFSVALPSLKDGTMVTAQWVNLAANGSVSSFGPVSDARIVGSCAQNVPAQGTAKPPVLTTSVPDSTGAVTFNLTGTKGGTFRLCVNDLPNAKVSIVNANADGQLVDAQGKPVTAPAIGAGLGDVVVAQAVSSIEPDQTGPVSAGVGIGKCSATGTGAVKDKPTVNPVQVGSETVSGKVAKQKSGTIVRVCVGDYQVATAPIDENGNFTVGLQAPVMPGQSVIAQLVMPPDPLAKPPDPPDKFNYALWTKVQPKFAYSDFTATFVGGVEESGFSSQGLNTNGFLSAYARSPFYNGRLHSAAVWGRVRLLSGPLPSNVNVVAALTNPTGTVTTSNLSNVGQVVDYVVGPELRLWQKDRPNGNTERISFYGGAGATTPLTSNQLQYSLAAPPADSQQCFQLVGLYSTYLANGANNTRTNCTLVNSLTRNSVTTVSFAAEGRSNFLTKYGAGVRLTNIYPAKGDQAAYAGSVDLSMGQDQSITGGKFQGVVFRIDTVYPLALGSSPYLYLFGFAAMKTTRNMTSQPIILSTASSVTVPSPSVVVLPLTQPDRDFYRFGVGLNITALFCNLSSKGCSNKSGTSNATGGAADGAAAKN
jgi:hypothetical protein